MQNDILHDLFEQQLVEFSVKDFRKIINPKDLPHRDYEPLLKHVQYLGTNKNICKWLVNNGANGWQVYVQFMDWDEQIADRSINAREAANLLMWSGDVRLHCSCPAFKFWGMQYILTQLGASIVPETRFPHKRNPQLKGIACKHIRRAMTVMPFQTGYIAGAIKRQRQIRG